MGVIGNMRGGIPPPHKESMVFCSPHSLDSLVLTLLSSLVLLGSSTNFSLNREGIFPSSSQVVIGDLFSSTTSSILEDLRLLTFFFNSNANLCL